MKKIILAVVMVCLLAGCGTTSIVDIAYNEKFEIDNIASALVLPSGGNKKLLNIPGIYQHNWEIIAKHLTSKGVNVIPYDSAKAAFIKYRVQGHISIEQLGQLAKETNVDIIIVPSYDVASSFTEMVIIGNTLHFAYCRLNIYSRIMNSFIVGISSVGEYSSLSRLPTVIGALAAFVEPDIGLYGAAAGAVFDIANNFKSGNSRWEEAFEKCLNDTMNKLINPKKTKSEPKENYFK